MSATPSSSSDTTRAPDQIERDIRDTRAEVSSTLDAIQSKLTPGQMMDQALGYLRGSLPADFSRNLNETVRNNPLPVALVGIGLAWMMFSGRSGSTVQTPRSASDWSGSRMDGFGSDGAGGSDHALSEGQGSAAGNATGSGLRDKAQQLADRTKEMAGSARERIADTASGARERIAGTASGARQRMSDMTQRTREQLGHARERAAGMLDEQPLLVGALGVALGAAVGAALPTTRREDELMGELRDDLMARGTDKAREVADRATGKARELLDQGAARAHHDVDSVAERV